MLVDKAEIQHYIPQRQPMIMVDILLANNDTRTISKFKIIEENIFCSDGYFTEPGLIENMAQTAALQSGYEAKQNKEKVKIGFIGAVKNLKIHQLPEVSSSIETTITITNNFGNIILVKGEVVSEGKLMAESEMSIFTREEIKKDEG